MYLPVKRLFGTRTLTTVQIVVIEMRSCVHHIGQVDLVAERLAIFQCRLIWGNPGIMCAHENAAGKPDGIFSS